MMKHDKNASLPKSQIVKKKFDKADIEQFTKQFIKDNKKILKELAKK